MITKEIGPWRNEYYGKSTDTKPTTVKIRGQLKPVPNASTFYEMDTKKVFMFDQDTMTWLEQ